MRTRNVGYAVRRMRQTPTLFSNYPAVFAGLVRGATPWAAPEVTFRLRNGCTVVAPNVAGARFPVYEIFADDAYRLDELCAGLAEDLHVLDVGGQIGSFSLAVASLHPAATVHVYEASPTSASYVRRNVEANDLGDRVTVHPAALAGTAGTFTFVDSGTASGHNGLTAPDGLGREVTVPATTFDAAIALLGGRADLVKMDVEGAEYDIILGSDPLSWRSVRRMVMEYHPVPGHDVEELVSFLSEVGLRPVRHQPSDKPGLGVMWLARD